MQENRLLLLAIIVIISLITLQGYFNWQYLQIQKGQLEREINQALEIASNKDLDRRKQIILDWLENYLQDSTRIRVFSEWSEEDNNWTVVLSDPLSEDRYVAWLFEQYKGKRNDTPGKDNIINRIVNHAAEQLREKSYFYYTEEIGQGIEQLVTTTPVDTIQLTKDFNTELAKLSIPEHYELQFLTDPKAATVGSKLISRPAELHLSNDELYVVASYENPFGVILRRSAWIIFSSILIILSAAFIYYFMTRAFRRQKKLQDMKDDFIDQVSHELRTPLSTLKVAVEALGHATDTADQNRDYLQICDHQIDKLSSMVDAIVINTSLTPQALFKDDTFQINQALKQEIDRQKLRYGERLTAQFTSEEITANGDMQHFQQAIGNLIDNAISHNPSTNKKVEIHLSSESEWVDIQIADNGPGIPSQISEKVFEKYIRASEKVKGLGIGLYYVKNVIDHMQGFISFESGSNGTTFTIRLPRS